MATTYYGYSKVPTPHGGDRMTLLDRCERDCAVHECIHCGNLRTHAQARADGPCMCDGNFPEVAQLVDSRL